MGDETFDPSFAQIIRMTDARKSPLCAFRKARPRITMHLARMTRMTDTEQRRRAADEIEDLAHECSAAFQAISVDELAR